MDHSYYQQPFYASPLPQAHQPLPSYSNPSSIHSSPCTYPSDLEVDLTTSLSSLPPSSFAPCRPAVGSNMRPKVNSFPTPLSVATGSSTLGEHDPSEYTARPGNAHAHAAFHSHSLPSQAPNTEIHPLNGASSSVGQSTNGGQQAPSGDGHPSVSGEMSDSQYTTSTPGVSGGLTRPLTTHEQERLTYLDRLKFFLATAPSRWDTSAAATSSTSSTSFHSETDHPLGISPPPGHPQSTHPALNRFLLPSNEYVTCVLWNGLYHITGTDIVRALVFRFEAFGRPVRNMKKFEEGVFSDLRNLKPGVDACLEEPKSPFLDLLFKYQCIRTQKKQKVFYWFSVPHDRLFLDALERDLKREKMGQEPTTIIVGEPALSFTYDSKKTLYEQFSKASGAKDGEGELEAAVRRADEARASSHFEIEDDSAEVSGEASNGGSDEDSMAHNASDNNDESTPISRVPPHLNPKGPFFNMISLFGGSPTYKQRRKKGVRQSSLSSTGLIRKHSEDSESERGRYHTRLPSSERHRYASASQSQSRERSDMEVDLDLDYGSGLSAAELFVAQTQLGERKRHNEKRRTGSFSGENSGLGLLSGNEAVRMRRRPSRSSRDEGGYYNGFDGAPQSLPDDRRNSFPNHLPGYQQSYQLHPSNSNYSSEGYLIGTSEMATDNMRKISKAYVCPLISCGRMFKQAEHVKTHYQAHMFDGSDITKRFVAPDQTDMDLKKWEADVQGDVQEVPGDEGSLIAAPGTRVLLPGYAGSLAVSATASSVYVVSPSSDSSFATTGSGFGEGAFAETQWATRRQFSPAFSTHSSLHSSPGDHIRRSLSSSSASSHYNLGPSGSTDNLHDPLDYSTSVSAPSHKLSFDHPVPPFSAGIVDGTGPIRRHRSMTPSLVRPDSGRRPLTATGGEFTSLGSQTAGRAYHPYMGYASANHSRGGSSQSSPATYPIPLEYVSSTGSNQSQPRSSRGSVVLDDQHLAQMEALHVDSGRSELFGHNNGHSAQMSVAFGNVYRTESPAPFSVHSPPAPLVSASPQTFGITDLPYMMDNFAVSSAPGGHPSHVAAVGAPGQFAKQENWNGGQAQTFNGANGVQGEDYYQTFADPANVVL